ncbi:hypothetical protein J1614_006004, partial [Plenodomus biglobosus]
MRFIILAASVPVALAAWNQEFCSGVGACVNPGGPVNPDPFRCPDGSALTIPSFGTDLRVAGTPDATPVKKEDFPDACLGGATPGPNDRLVVVTTRNNQRAYAFITEDCRETAPEVPGDCYNFNTNPSTYTFCALIDSSDRECVTNPEAGVCERWGNTAGRSECEGWKIGQPDAPDDFEMM